MILIESRIKNTGNLFFEELFRYEIAGWTAGWFF